MFKFVPCLFINSLPLESVGPEEKRGRQRERKGEKHRGKGRENEREEAKEGNQKVRSMKLLASPESLQLVGVGEKREGER